MVMSCWCDDVLADGVHGWSVSDGTAFRSFVRLGGSQNCFCCFVAVSLMNVGLRGLLSRRTARLCR